MIFFFNAFLHYLFVFALWTEAIWGHFFFVSNGSSSFFLLHKSRLVLEVFFFFFYLDKHKCFIGFFLSSWTPVVWSPNKVCRTRMKEEKNCRIEYVKIESFLFCVVVHWPCGAYVQVIFQMWCNWISNGKSIPSMRASHSLIFKLGQFIVYILRIGEKKNH